MVQFVAGEVQDAEPHIRRELDLSVRFRHRSQMALSTHLRQWRGQLAEVWRAAKVAVMAARSIAPALVGSALLAACAPRVEVLARSVSPDGQLDAVHAQPKTGATDGFVDWVYVVPHGAKVSGKPIFIADSVRPALDVKWSGGTLIIKAEAARVFTLASETRTTAKATPIQVLIPNRQP